MAAGFLSGTESAVTGGFSLVANAFGSGLLTTFRPAFIVGFTIWIALISYEVAFGKSEDSFTYIFTKIGKIFLIGTIALWGWPDLKELLESVKEGFVGGTTISGILEAQLVDPMLNLWARIYEWYTSAMSQVGPLEFSRMLSTVALFFLLLISYAAMALAVIVFACIALTMYLIANSVFILLLALGPFFLLCLSFPFTQRFFETYIGNVMTAIFGMAFTVLMIMFVSNTLFHFTGIENTIPISANEAVVSSKIKSLAPQYAAQSGAFLLIIYLFFKVFDLAASLGGGLNMGNNLVGGVRSIMRDLQRGSGNRSASGTTNSISRGSGGAPQRAGRANSTFTGTAVSAMSPALSSAARGVGGLVSAAASGAGNLGQIASYGAGRAAGAATSVGRYAYNRYSALNNRVSAR